MNTIYQFSAQNLQGKDISLNDYQGKTVLIVNTASHCKYTPQYQGLEELYQKYKEKDFIILGFPCNQFGKQEPGDEKAIAKTCYQDYNVTFPIFSKIEVNGKGTHPLYQFLKKAKTNFFVGKIIWNFDKFLINQEGVPIKRYMPFTKPEKIGKQLE